MFTDILVVMLETTEIPEAGLQPCITHTVGLVTMHGLHILNQIGKFLAR